MRRKILIAAALAVVGLSFTVGATNMNRNKPKPKPQYCQQHISNHPEHKHVLVDTKTGEVTWTFHNNSTVVYPNTLPRRGTINGVLPAVFSPAKDQSLGGFSDKLRTWCGNHGFLPNLSRTNP